MRFRPGWLLLLLCIASPTASAQAGGAAPRDSVAVVLQFLARYRQRQAHALASGVAPGPDSVVHVTVRLGGRAGALLRDSLARRPLRMTGDEAPHRTLVVDSLVFDDGAAHLVSTSSGASATPGPWWEHVDIWRFRWDATARAWWLESVLVSRATDGAWRTAPRASRSP